MNAKFHLALPCKDAEATARVYEVIIGASLGRKSKKWLDVNLFGNQLTFTQSGKFRFDYNNYKLENHILPSFHFGIIVPNVIWQEIHDRLSRMNQETTPKTSFFNNKRGEHLSFFVKDPNGYMLEFKSYKDSGTIF